MIKYRIDVIKALKEKGYTSTIIKRDNLLPSQTLQNIKSGKTLTALKEGGNITIDTLNRLCIMLRCQPSDIIRCEITDDEKIKYFR